MHAGGSDVSSCNMDESSQLPSRTVEASAVERSNDNVNDSVHAFGK